MHSAGSAPSFAVAKIQPPRPRAGLVARPALERTLGDALAHARLTLLIAPAGCGKTAALTRQISRLPPGWALAWISADEDDDLQRFLACLTTALEPLALPWRVDPASLATLALGERGLRDLAGELINALAASSVPRGLVCIDDLHRLADSRVLQLLALLLERLPERWALVLASRTEPALPLARLRAQGELAEFRPRDLRFCADDVQALLAQCASLPSGTPIEASVAQLLARTDGWAAGLRLTLAGRAGSAAPRSSGPMQRHLFEYLAAEVFDELPPRLRLFLLRCAVLPELSAGRCAHVAGEPQAAELLEQIERRGLFVSVLDAPELTLRLHDLFRDFLEDRLAREHAAELPTLLHRAADGEPDLARAVGYLTRAGAWDEAARTLAERGMQLIGAGGGSSLERMLALFPTAERDARPALQMLRGIGAMQHFDFEGLVAAMQEAREGYTRAGQHHEALLAEAYRLIASQSTGQAEASEPALARLAELPMPDATRAFVHFSSGWAAYAAVRTERIAPHFAAMLAALERVTDPQAWEACYFHSLLVGLPELDPLIERFDAGAMRIAGDRPSQLRAGVMHSRAWLALAAGRLEDTIAWMRLADDDVRWLGMPRGITTENRMTHVLVDALRGDQAASLAAAHECEDDLEQASSSPGNRLSHAYEVYFTHARAAWILDDEAELRSACSRLAACANSIEWKAATIYRRFGEAFLAWLRGDLEAALLRLQPIALGDEPGGYFPAGQALVMAAELLRRLGRLDEAAGLLASWLDDASAGKRLGGALLAGPRVLRSLAAAPWGERIAPPARALLARLAAQGDEARRAAWTLPQAPADAPPQAPSARPTEAPAPPPQAAASAVEPPVPLRPPSASAAPNHPALTDREVLEVLSRIAAGDSNKLIARTFDLSPHTVKRHVANILGKLGVQTRGQAAARWRERAKVRATAARAPAAGQTR